MGGRWWQMSARPWAFLCTLQSPTSSLTWCSVWSDRWPIMILIERAHNPIGKQCGKEQGEDVGAGPEIRETLHRTRVDKLYLFSRGQVPWLCRSVQRKVIDCYWNPTKRMRLHYKGPTRDGEIYFCLNIWDKRGWEGSFRLYVTQHAPGGLYYLVRSWMHIPSGEVPQRRHRV